uniref:Putative salivary secreted peptide n=1 Tax=Ixodes ricinus TaxID=34613 RepID=A0A6B0V3Q8_IXORI
MPILICFSSGHILWDRLTVLEIKWMLAYFLLSSLLVLGNAQEVNNLAERAQAATNKATTPKATAAQEKTAASTSQQAVQQKATPKATAAPEPSAPTPSTDPIICDLKKNKSGLALPSLQCTLQELPENLKVSLKNYMTTAHKNESDLLEEICKAIEEKKNPDFMSNYTVCSQTLLSAHLARLKLIALSKKLRPNFYFLLNSCLISKIPINNTTLRKI